MAGRRTRVPHRPVGAVLLLAVAIGAHASSTPLLAEGFVARCSEPTGPTLEFGWHHRVDGEVIGSPADGFRTGTDRFRGMEPVFIYRPSEPNLLLGIWGTALPEDVTPEALEEHPTASVDRNVVVARTEEMVSAVYRTENGVWVTTLYPPLGIAYISYHQATRSTLSTTTTGHPQIRARSSALSAECRFSTRPPMAEATD